MRPFFGHEASTYNGLINYHPVCNICGIKFLFWVLLDTKVYHSIHLPTRTLRPYTTFRVWNFFVGTRNRLFILSLPYRISSVSCYYKLADPVGKYVVGSEVPVLSIISYIYPCSEISSIS